jgi:hypothetical protein
MVRQLLECDARPADIGELRDALGDLGWTVEREGNRLDVVVASL